MRTKLLTLVLGLASFAASAAPGNFTSLECTFSRLASDGGYYGVDLLKGESGYTLKERRYRSRGAFMGGEIVSTTIETELTCERIHPRARSITCSKAAFQYTLMDVIQIDPTRDERTNVLVSAWLRNDQLGTRREFAGVPIKTGTYQNYCDLVD